MALLASSSAVRSPPPPRRRAPCSNRRPGPRRVCSRSAPSSGSAATRASPCATPSPTRRPTVVRLQQNWQRCAFGGRGDRPPRARRRREPPHAGVNRSSPSLQPARIDAATASGSRCATSPRAARSSVLLSRRGDLPHPLHRRPRDEHRPAHAPGVDRLRAQHLSAARRRPIRPRGSPHTARQRAGRPPRDGLRGRRRTGAILRKWDDRQTAAAPSTRRPRQRAELLPRCAHLPAGRAADGTYSLVSPLHGTCRSRSRPRKARRRSASPPITGLSTSGRPDRLPAYTGHDGNSWATAAPSRWPTTSRSAGCSSTTTRTQRRLAQHALDSIGETAAVDAQYGLAMTWDFYKNVFGRNGIDGQGTSTMAIVHDITGRTRRRRSRCSTTPTGRPRTSAWCSATAAIGDPTGLRAVTELDVTGHELSHGVCFATANLLYTGQSGGLNEGNSDMFGKMVQAYADGGATGAHIATSRRTIWWPGRSPQERPQRRPAVHVQTQPRRCQPRRVVDGIDELNVHFSSARPTASSTSSRWRLEQPRQRPLQPYLPAE